MVHSFDTPVFTDFFNPHDFDAVALARGFVHENVFRHQLAVVFIGGNHVHGVAFFFCLFGQGANHVIGFITLHHHDGDVHGFNNFFDPGNRYADVLGLLFAVGLVGFVHVVPKRGAMWVKSHRNVRGFFGAHEVP